MGAGNRVTLEGIVTRAQGVFARIQDETGGITLRQTSGAFSDALASGAVAQGDIITITGTLSEFAALLQLNGGDIESFEVLSRDNPLPEAIRLTLAEIAAEGEQYESMLVTVDVLSIDTADLTFAAATTYTIGDNTLDDGSVTLRIPNEGDGSVDGEPVPTDGFLFEGVLGQFSFGEPDVGYQLQPINTTDIVPFVPTDTEADLEIPEVFTVYSNYPNPFNPTTTLRFDLPAPAEVTVEIFDVVGRRVLVLPMESIPAGRDRTLTVDGARLSSGVYFYRILARTTESLQVGTGKMTLLK